MRYGTGSQQTTNNTTIQDTMKTVQSYFQTLDKDKLVETYLTCYPICYEDYLYEEVTDDDGEKADLSFLPVKEIREAHERSLASFIDKMRTIPIEAGEDGRTGCLYAYRTFDDGRESVDFDLIFLDEGPDALPYGVDFCTQGEIAGFLVADNVLTQQKIYRLMAFVMHEATFFGFDQEGLPELLETIEKAEKAIREGRIREYDPDMDDEDSDDEHVYKCDLDEFNKWMESETGASELPDYEETPEEKELSSKVYETMNAFSEYSRMREREEIFAKWKTHEAKI